MKIEIKPRELVDMEKKFKFIRKDETELWDEAFRKRFSITKVTATYVYDPTEKIHCCDIRPSYFLRYLGSDMENNCSAILKDDFDEEAFEAEMLGGDADHYMYCAAVDSMSPEIVKGDIETIDEAIEEFHCNPW